MKFAEFGKELRMTRPAGARLYAVAVHAFALVGVAFLVASTLHMMRPAGSAPRTSAPAGAGAAARQVPVDEVVASAEPRGDRSWVVAGVAAAGTQGPGGEAGEPTKEIAGRAATSPPGAPQAHAAGDTNPPPRRPSAIPPAPDGAQASADDGSPQDGAAPQAATGSGDTDGLGALAQAGGADDADASPPLLTLADAGAAAPADQPPLQGLGGPAPDRGSGALATDRAHAAPHPLLALADSVPAEQAAPPPAPGLAGPAPIAASQPSAGAAKAQAQAINPNDAPAPTLAPQSSGQAPNDAAAPPVYQP